MTNTTSHDDKRFRELIESIPNVAVQGYDRHRKVIYWNRASTKIYGYTFHEAIGKKLEDLIIPEEMREGLISAVTAWIEQGQPIPPAELHLRHKNGSEVPVFSSHVMLEMQTDNPVMFCLDVDLREFHEMETNLLSKQKQLELVITGARLGFWDRNLITDHLEVNARWLEILGLKRQDIKSHKSDWSNLLHPEDKERIMPIIQNSIDQRIPYVVEFRMRHKKGFWVWIEGAGSVVEVDPVSGEAIRLCGTNQDITKRKAAEMELDRLARFDTLTGLPNRHTLYKELEAGMNEASRKGRDLALLFIDLDNFKIINDNFGHDQGDELLVQVTRRISSSIRNYDLFARFGGDEFILVTTDLEYSNAAALAQNILLLLKQPFFLSGREVYVSASIGIALYPGDSDSMSSLLKNADMAMYKAKDFGKNRFQFFASDMNDEVTMRLNLDSKLRKALKNKELQVYYQPILAANSQQLLSCEALMRWYDPEEGFISPEKFIRVAEETDLINEIGSLVLKEACCQVKRWQEKGLDIPKVAVNISARQFHFHNICKQVEEALQCAGLDPGCLELELTESTLIGGDDHILQLIHTIKEMGISLSLDDFGTGYSSLGYLKRFPIDTIKIDRSFIADIPDDPEDSALVRAIIAMTQNLGKKIIAEGVENDQQHTFLQDHHVEMVQGYLFAKPMSAADFEQWLQKKPFP